MAMDLDEFCPTDSELFTFLLRFLAKEPLCDDGFITELDVYKQPPWVTYSYGRHSCGVKDDSSSCRYFITPIPPIRKRRRRPFYRIVDGNVGKWKEGSFSKKIINLGRKKSLFYKCDDKNEDEHENDKWIMAEYQLSETLLRKFYKSDRDYVICAIRKINSRKKYKKNLKTAQQPKKSQENVIEESMIINFDKLMLENNDGETSAEKREKSSLVAHLVEAMAELEVDK